MIFKTFTTAFDDTFEHVNDMVNEYEYDGIDDVPYLSTGFNIGMSSGRNYLIVAVDECHDVIMGGVILHVGDVESLNGTGATSWVAGIGVNPAYQGKGLCRFLINELFELCEELSLGKVEQSSYTDDGSKKVKHIFEEVKDFYPSVDFIDVLNIDSNNYCVIVEED